MSDIKITSENPDSTLCFEAEKRGKKVLSEELKKTLIEQAHALGHLSTKTLFRRL